MGAGRSCADSSLGDAEPGAAALDVQAEIAVDVRIIAATHRDLEKAIEEGRFRRDLMFRLDVVTIQLPPLRARGDDLRLLAQHFATRFATEFKKRLSGIEETAYAKLRTYAWPGNVRELRNVIERAVLLGRGERVTADDITLGTGEPQPLTGWDLERISLPPEGFDIENLGKLEARLLLQALERTHQNQTQAAKLLNISRDRLRYRLEKHSLLSAKNGE